MTVRGVRAAACLWAIVLSAPMLSLAAAGGPDVGRAGPQGSQALAAAIRTLFSVIEFDQVAISPDGRKVAWVQSGAGGQEGGRKNTSIHVIDLTGGGAPRRITAGDAGPGRAEGSIAWSPDSRSLAFLSDARQPGQKQMYVAAWPGLEVRPLTDVKGALAAPAWSPDGTRLAVLLTENVTGPRGPLAAGAARVGVIEESTEEQRLAVVDAAGGVLRPISPADTYVYEYDWSPDGGRFVATAARGSGDDNWYRAAIVTIDASTGLTRVIHEPPLQVARPVWSPDGSRVAFIAGLMSDEDVVGNDLFVWQERDGSVENLTAGTSFSVSWAAWEPGGSKLLVARYLDGEAGLAEIDPATRAVSELWRGAERIGSSRRGGVHSVALDGRTSAVIRQSFGRPPEVWAGPIGAWRQITSVNAGLEAAWGEARSLHWNSDGLEIQGWLVAPPHVDPSRRYPLVVNVHGGPASMAESHWPGRRDSAAALANDGFFVLYPNPRGSFGRGEAFVRANVKDFGYGDLRDILAGLEEAARAAPIDPGRVGITGWSYGGYMTMWAITRTDRFRAAVAGAGIANYQSYYGQNRIDQWMLPYFGASVYDDPAVYARSSPITFIKRAKTPALLLVGEGDGECPPPQSFEFWHALKALGVETQLVVYPHEGHMFESPENLRDLIERSAAWLGGHLR